MVQLLIKLGSDVADWSLVELQGQLETRDAVPFNNMHIGDLYFKDSGVANLIIGHHILTGQVVYLEQPLAVMKRKRHNSVEPGQDESAMEIDVVSSQTEYNIIAFIKRKVIFKDRPKPIVQKDLLQKGK